MKGRLCLCFIMVCVLMQKQQVKAQNIIELDNYCFYNENEFTNKEKCEKLLEKNLIDEEKWLKEGVISKEVYELQIEPIIKALNYVKNASKEEANSFYKEILLLNSDWLESDIEAGEEIDEEFYQYIEEEIKRIQ